MLTLTFNRYDEIAEEAELLEIDDDFVFPNIEDAPKMLVDESGLKTLLVAFYNTTDKQYAKAINTVLTEEIFLFDDEELKASNENAFTKNGKLILSKEENLNIIEKVKNMDFQLIGFFPTKQDIDTYLEANSEENLAFLYWVVNTPMDDLTKEEEKSKNYILKQINNRVKIKED